MTVAYLECTWISKSTQLADHSLGIPGVLLLCVFVSGPIIHLSFSVQPSATKGSPAYYAAFQDEWREVFILSAELYLFGMLIYLILGSGEEQSWAKKKKVDVLSRVSSPDTDSEKGISSKMPPFARVNTGIVQVS